PLVDLQQAPGISTGWVLGTAYGVTLESFMHRYIESMCVEPATRRTVERCLELTQIRVHRDRVNGINNGAWIRFNFDYTQASIQKWGGGLAHVMCSRLGLNPVDGSVPMGLLAEVVGLSTPEMPVRDRLAIAINSVGLLNDPMAQDVSTANVMMNALSKRGS